MPLIVATP